MAVRYVVCRRGWSEVELLVAVATSGWWSLVGSRSDMALDRLGGVLFADEHFQEAELGFDALVLPILIHHGQTILLLSVPAIHTPQLSICVCVCVCVLGMGILSKIQWTFTLEILAVKCGCIHESV